MIEHGRTETIVWRAPSDRIIITLEKVDIESGDGYGVLGDHCVSTEAVKCHFAHVQSSLHHTIGSILTKNILKFKINNLDHL